MQKILTEVLKTTEAVEDYKVLKENMIEAEFAIIQPKAAYAEVKIQSRNYS